MIEQHDANFNDLACRWLSNGRVRLAVTTGRGPRIVFCGVGEGRNLLVETPEFLLPSPNGPLGLLGGHRLWYAPELPERTYWPDDRPVTVEEVAGGARFIAAIDGRWDAARPSACGSLPILHHRISFGSAKRNRGASGTMGNSRFTKASHPQISRIVRSAAGTASRGLPSASYSRAT